MPQQQETERACWEKPPYTCPVKVPVSLVATSGGVTWEVRIGVLQADDANARVVLGASYFEAREDMGIPASTGALSKAADRIEHDLAVGAVVRRIVGRKPLLAKLLETLVGVLAADAEDGEKEVLQGLVSQEAYTSHTTDGSS